jgi:MFS family permease
MLRQIFTHDFILGWFAQFAFAAAHQMLYPTLPIYLSKSGAGEAEIGILIGIFGVSSLIVRPLVGRSLVRISERKIMMAGASILALTFAAYFVVLPFWPFLAARIIQGVGYAFFSTAVLTLSVNVSPEAHRGQSLGYFLLSVNLSLALSPALGMLLIDHFGFTHLFLLGLGLSLFSLSVSYKVTKRDVVSTEAPSAEDGFLFSRKALPPSVVSLLQHFGWGALIAFFPLYSISQGVANPGWFFTVIAIMLILCRAFGGNALDRWSREKVILPCLFAYIIAMGLLAFSKTLPMFILAAAIWGLGTAFCTPATMAYTIERAGTSRGPAIGTYTTGSDLGVALGPVVMGIIIRYTSYRTMFLCGALIAFINLIYFYFLVRKKGGRSDEHP